MALTQRYAKLTLYRNENNFDDVIEKQLLYPNAYIKICNMRGDKEDINFRVCVYENNSKETIVENRYYKFKPSIADGSTNFIQQGYEYLKTLPEYVSAVDC